MKETYIWQHLIKQKKNKFEGKFLNHRSFKMLVKSCFVWLKNKRASTLPLSTIILIGKSLLKIDDVTAFQASN